MRVYNFSAGPSTLPEIVLERIKSHLPEHGESGMSVMEMSHRSSEFIAIASKAENLLRELMQIPDNYKVLFLQGGATGQFAAIPLNLTNRSDIVDYVITGMWGNKAYKEAQKYVDHVHIAAKPENFVTVPDFSTWQVSPNAKYLHITPNETVHGVAFNTLPDTDIPLIGDISSVICAEPIDVSKYGVLYAGAQKNLGPAGLAIVIIREDLLHAARAHVPTVWDWAGKAESQSMLNTPPTFSWYVISEVLEWLKKDVGGLTEMQKINQRKAAKLYDYIEASDFYSNPVDKGYRSIMNVPFLLKNNELDKKFIQEAKSQGLVNLAGHRAVGGMRASIYNGMPESGIDALVNFMKEFEKQND